MRQIEKETNISDREVRTHLDGIRNINVNADTQTSCLLIDVTLPTDVSEQRSIQHADQSIHDSESLRGSCTRSPDAGSMIQYPNWMVLCLLGLDLEEECQKMQE